MSNEDERDALQRVQYEKRRRLRVLEYLEAKHGADLEPARIIEIEELRQELGMVDGVQASSTTRLFAAMQPYERTEVLRQQMLYSRDHTVDAFKEKIQDVRDDVLREFKEVRERLDAFDRRISRIGFWLVVIGVILGFAFGAVAARVFG